MATGQETVTIDFGGWPGSNEAQVAVTGQTAISVTSKADAFIMGDDSTTDHTASDHRYLACLVGLTCGTPTAGTGFTVYARSFEKLQGTYKLRVVWAD
jgi:hypothetical protein